jgi:HPt (histidine-containing phosphotransfer) domain-containing protein
MVAGRPPTLKSAAAGADMEGQADHAAHRTHSMAVAPDSSPVIEPAALASIASLDPEGKSGLVARIVALFTTDSAKQVHELRGALDAGDVPLARRLVHTLKSSSANVGAMALARLSADAEAHAVRGSLVDIEAMYPALQALQQAAVAELRALHPGPAP